MTYKKNTIVLIPVPFTDLSSQKRRPVLILCDQVDQDIICIPISSQSGTTNIDIPVLDKNCHEFTFPIPSYIRTRKIYTLHAQLVVKTLGNLDSDFFEKVKSQIIKYLQQ